MKKIILTLVLGMLVVTTSAQISRFNSKMTLITNDYVALWLEVNRLEEQSLPQSAMEKVTFIYQKALTEKNSAQLIKALIHQLKYESVIDKDQLPTKLLEIEKYTQEDSNRVEQSMLYSVLAQLYYQYYQSDRYKIKQRTAIAGTGPEDIREWPENLFIRQIVDYIKLSFKASKELQATDISNYQEIIIQEDSSRSLQPTVYDFLMNQGIELLSQINNPPHDFSVQIENYYRQWIEFRKQANDKRALLMVELNYLATIKSEDAYVHALDSLEQQYAKEDICVEILFKKAQYLSQLGNRKIIPLMNEDNEEDEKSATNQRNGQAYQVCLDALSRYPNYERIGIITNLKNQLTIPYVRVSSSNTVYPGEKLDLHISHHNIRTLTIEVYKISAPITTYENYWESQSQYKKTGTLIDKRTVQLDNTYPYIESDTTFQIPMKDLGCYEYVIYSDQNKEEVANQQFSVSRLAAASRYYQGQYEFLVTDRLSGKPIEGAQVHLYNKKNNQNQLVSTIQTDRKGCALKKQEETKDLNLSGYNVSIGDDKNMILSPLPWGQDYRSGRTEVENLSLFTDRNLYRPGQTVFFKGIAYSLGKDKQQVISKQNYTVFLRDANGKDISKKVLTTNEFGSFSGEFILPSVSLNGTFSLMIEDGSGAYFQVEEYKRPSFDIRFLPIEKTFHFGDQITAKGSAQTFSGVKIQNTPIKYRVVQRSHWLWRMVYRTENQIAEGTVTTNNEGLFEVHFPAEKLDRDKEIKEVYYTYEIEASLTDSKGETQEVKTYVSIGDKSMYLQVDSLNENIDKDHLPSVTISAFNLNSQPVKCVGTYQIHRLKGEQSLDKTLLTKDWKTDLLIDSGSFTSGEKFFIQSLQKAASGKYRISIQTQDDRGRVITKENDFILYSTNDKQPPVMVYEWVQNLKPFCEPGENAEILYGSSAKNVYVLFDIFKDGQKLESSRFELNNNTKKILFPFKESYEEGVVISLTFIKDAKLFTQNIEINRKKAAKELTLRLDVFRDKLLPGQKEEWKVSIKDADKNPVQGEILAAMYDASLDKLSNTNSWHFYPTYQESLWRPYLMQNNAFNNAYGQFYLPESFIETTSLSFNRFNWFDLNFYNNLLRRDKQMLAYGGENQVQQTLPASMQSTVMENLALSSEAKASGIIDRIDDGITNKVEESIQIRQNFNETAFFYPQLQTNKAGETLISFTVPESNTTWKFQALAHTRDLKYGQIIKEAISQKKLMVSPNLPRFVRQGDKTSISSTISNLSEETLSGTISIEFFDPTTETTTILLGNASQSFTVEPGKSTSVSWTFDIPSGIDLTACKIIAKTPTFSDGEQHLLPVLPNRMLVTETLPLSISGKGNKQFALEKLVKNSSKTLENHRLTLEFASNPAWYAVQALPSMATPVDENVISLFGAFYANSLATSIANSTPQIKNAIDSWIRLGGTKETLLSNLEKNQELKIALLQETPWVMEAKDESEQKQRLGLLFDINRTNDLSLTTFDKLIALQMEDGGWSWFKGMQSDVSITQWILYGMGNLLHLKALPSDNRIDNASRQGLSFIDKKFIQNFETLKKQNKTWTQINTISTYELEYLFVRGFYSEVDTATNINEAIHFYTSIIEKNWTKIPGLYDRALATTIMQKAGKTTIATAIVNSLRQHASKKDELGMYWANNNARSFMLQSATAIHTFMMEAFQVTGATAKEMDALKMWLLKQKQTQQWESTPATVNAISVLLQTGTDWLENKNQVSIRLGNQKVESDNQEAGTGYIKKVYEKPAIQSGMGKISISKEDDGPAWGALYWQYFEDMDKVTVSKTSLNVEKKLFVEKITSTGKTLEAVTETHPLYVGDKVIVRLTVRNDRDMEFVMLKDLRGSCFEPAEQISGIKWNERLIYYQTSKDVSTNYYWDHLPKGTYVFEYPMYATRTGEYSNGNTTIQCLYAPEFNSSTTGTRIIIND